MLEDECTFWDRHMGLAGRTERILRLAGRACKGILRKESSSFQRITLQELRRRLFTRRKNRLLAGDAINPHGAVR